ncbi:zinc finger protein Gfi-1-like isoform X1 [Eulemur rufifrons]|uniref:zinc finger protein Gfi-1-like isoform X1 n=1 Tax=Eulemur rufifrons TaxID=859984 RepID=UPI003742F639
MDVTSQLNLEREAGMGENTERQPAEPESAGGGGGGGSGGGGRAQGGGAKGAGDGPGGGQAAAFFLHRVASTLASLPAARSDSCPAPPAPPNTRSFACLRKATHPKTTNQKQQISQIESPNVLGQCSMLG